MSQENIFQMTCHKLDFQETFSEICMQEFYWGTLLETASVRSEGNRTEPKGK